MVVLHIYFPCLDLHILSPPTPFCFLNLQFFIFLFFIFSFLHLSFFVSFFLDGIWALIVSFLQNIYIHIYDSPFPHFPRTTNYNSLEGVFS